MSTFRNQSLEINDYTEDQIFDKNTFAIEMELQKFEIDPDDNIPDQVAVELCKNTGGRTPKIVEVEWMHNANKEARFDYYSSLKNYYRYRFPVWSDNHLSWWNHFHIFFKYWQTTKTLFNMTEFQIIKMQYFLMNVPLYAKPYRENGKLYFFNRENSWFKPYYKNCINQFDDILPHHHLFNTEEKRNNLIRENTYRNQFMWLSSKSTPFTMKISYTGWTHYVYDRGQERSFITSRDTSNESAEVKKFTETWSMSIEFRCNNVIDWRLYGYYLAAILYAMSDDDKVFYKIKPLKHAYELFSWDQSKYRNELDEEEIPDSIHFDEINKKDFNLVEWTDLDYLKYNYTQMMKILNTCNLPNTTAMLQEYCSEIWLTA